MKMTLAIPFLAFAALPALAVAQESASLLDAPPRFEAFSSMQEQRGDMGEVWISPRTRVGLSLFYRLSVPGDSRVTVDNLWYSDFFSVGNGIEADLMSYVMPQWGVGAYLSAGWDRFQGQRLNFFNGDFADVGDMDLSTAIVGGKFQQRVGPFLSWEGRMGVGWMHYSSVKWSGVDAGTPFSGEELFKAIDRAVFELGFRLGFGDRRIEGDFGFGFRYMGAAARGKDVSNAIDPELFYTFMIELGLTVKF